MADDLITFEREGARDLIVQQLIERTRRISDPMIQSVDDLLPWLDDALRNVPQPPEDDNFDKPFTAIELEKLRSALRTRRSEIDHGRPAARALNMVIEAVDHVMRVSFGNPTLTIETPELEGRIASSPTHKDIIPSGKPKKGTQDSAPRTPRPMPDHTHWAIKPSSGSGGPRR